MLQEFHEGLRHTTSGLNHGHRIVLEGDAVWTLHLSSALEQRWKLQVYLAIPGGDLMHATEQAQRFASLHSKQRAPSPFHDEKLGWNGVLFKSEHESSIYKWPIALPLTPPDLTTAVVWYSRSEKRDSERRWFTSQSPG